MDTTTLIVLAVVAGILFDITNGWNDAANAIATVVSTRVLSPWQALLMSAALNFVGALISIKVATSMGSGVVNLKVDPSSVAVVLSAMVGAASWVTWCTRLGLPISCSHALVGGLVGAAVAVEGWGSVVWNDPVKHKGLLYILVALLASPFIGFVVGYLLLVACTWIARRATPSRGHRVFGWLQLGSASFMAFEHGQNDAQKVMGVLALALFVGGFLRKDGHVVTDIKELYIPVWIILSCAAAMAFGTAVGGWRVIRTMGSKLAKISTTEGFAAETGGGVVLQIAASLGIPVSTTHTITGSIVGVGTAKGARAVKWGIGAKIVYAWVFTLPMSFLFGGVLSWFAALASPFAMVSAVAVVSSAVFLIPGLVRRAARSRMATVAAAAASGPAPGAPRA